MTLSITPVQAVDHDAIWTMLKPVFRAGETYTIDRDVSRDTSLSYWLTGRAYIASDEEPLGTYYIQRNRAGGGSHYCNCGFISHVPRRGVARAMLKHALVEAKALGYDGMVFNAVVASNTRAVQLWRGAGFEQVGCVPGGFKSPGGELSDLLVMFKKL